LEQLLLELEFIIFQASSLHSLLQLPTRKKIRLYKAGSLLGHLDYSWVRTFLTCSKRYPQAQRRQQQLPSLRSKTRKEVACSFHLKET